MALEYIFRQKHNVFCSAQKVSALEIFLALSVLCCGFCACILHCPVWDQCVNQDLVLCRREESCWQCDAFSWQKTEGYSGSDIKLVSKEAAMRPVRKIFAALENHTEGREGLHLCFGRRLSCYLPLSFHVWIFSLSLFLLLFLRDWWKQIYYVNYQSLAAQL